MINVRKVSKIYYSEKIPVYALRNVSLSLPSQGMVFIVGKSGSGKSTLLNILAGFDNPTYGNVFYGDTNLNNLSSTQIDYYRNSVVGFVFQDYCLIETFTVKQNITVAVDYKKGKISDKEIDEILTSVGMKGYEDRYPHQLSAGQKQRVAIARALAKNSKIILADEPTGNLDSKTTTQILDLLKEISKSRLVVVVSHSKDDAFKYADRIIEISNGQIVKDRHKNELYDNSLNINNNVITLPAKKRLTNEQINQVNDVITHYEGNVIFQKRSEEFVNYNEKHRMNHITIEKTSMGFKNLLKYSWLFFKNQLFSFFLVVFIVTFLITTLTLSLQFGTYDGLRQYGDAIEKSQSPTFLVMQNGELETTTTSQSRYMYEFNEEKGKEIKDEFEHKSYNVYNYFFPISSPTGATYIHHETASFYALNKLLVCDENYLRSVFSHEDGTFSYYGDISSSADGIIITDVLADYLLFSKSSTYKIYNYDDILESTYIKNYGAKICAIIDTPYDYQSMRDKEMIESFDSAADYSDAIIKDYASGYTTNPDYYPTYIENVKQKAAYFPVALQSISTVDGKEEYQIKDNLVYFSTSAKRDEIIISYTAYNELFGTSCSSSDKKEFVKREITYRTYDFQNNKIIEENLLISNLSNYTYLNPSRRSDVIGDSFYKIGEMFTNIDNKGKFYIEAVNNNFYIVSYSLSLIDTVVKCIAIFKDMFKMLSIIMIVSIIVLIIVNTVNIMNRNIYNIGVSRSLGAHLGELGFIYSIQMIVFGVLVILFSTISTFFSLEFINDILSVTIPKVVEISGVEDITYLYFNPGISSSITSLVVFLTMVSIFFPILGIRLINPVTIIKKKT